MAEYTGASERIALGKKSRKEEAKKKKLEMVELIDDAYVLLYSATRSTLTYRFYEGRKKMRKRKSGRRNRDREADISKPLNLRKQ